MRSDFHSPLQPQSQKCIRKRHIGEDQLWVGRRRDEKEGQLVDTWFCQLLQARGSCFALISPLRYRDRERPCLTQGNGGGEAIANSQPFWFCLVLPGSARSQSACSLRPKSPPDTTNKNSSYHPRGLSLFSVSQFLLG